MDKVVIDTNVFISGLLFGGNPEKILQSWSRNEFILCISPELQAELIHKLQTKFKAPQEFTNNLLLDLKQHAKQFMPQVTISLLRDPNDNFLLALAETANADYVISGDKDVLTIKNYKNTKIISPAEFINVYTK